MAKSAATTPIGEWVRTTRARKSQSQTEAGKAIGVHFVTVSRWECGAKTPGIPALRGLAKWGGIEVGDLLGIMGA